MEVADLAAELARDASGDLIVGLSNATRKVVRSLVAQAMEHGWSDWTLKRRIKEVVGLDPRSAQAVQTYRRGLDAAKIPPGRADRQAQAYANRLLNHRVQVIAQSEAQKVMLQAQRLVWTQMQAQGDLSPYAVRITRIHKDEVTCPVCRSQNGRRNSLKHQNGGPPFHPNCRCTEELSDQGVAKASPEGGTLYVQQPIGNLKKCPRCGRRHKSHRCPIMPERM